MPKRPERRPNSPPPAFSQRTPESTAEARLLHPQPQMARAVWRLLDGPWEFAYDDEGRYEEPGPIPFDRTIQVPFPPESRASGIGDEGFHAGVWYRRRVKLLPSERSERLLVHFG